MFDITSLETADAAFLHLKSPIDEEPLFTGKGSAKAAVGITFYAPGSSEYEAASQARTNRALLRSKKKTELTADIVRADLINFYTAITKSFDQLGYPPAGEATGAELYKALYADAKYGWVLDQITAFLSDWANFTKASAKS